MYLNRRMVLDQEAHVPVRKSIVQIDRHADEP